MPRDVPVVPVSGTVITTAWATTVINAINWLYGLTGGANPPGVGYSIDSVSTTATTWIEKVNRVGDTMRGDLQVNRAGSGAPTQGYLILGNNAAYYIGFDGSQHFINTTQLQILGGDIVMGTNGTGIQLGANTGTKGRLYDSSGVLTVLRTHNNAFGVYTSNLVTQLFLVDNAQSAPIWKGNVVWHAGNDTRIGVPLNAVVWFPTLADLTAAGASWTRHTAADGRLLVGAGTASSPTLTNAQTFAEATNYGTDWGHGHANTLSASSSAIPAGTTGPLVPVAGGTTQVSETAHVHSAPTISVSGGVTSTVWIPGAYRAGIWARRI